MFEPLFIQTPKGQRFAIHHPAEPSSAARGLMVYLHPWGEEMNKSRRMAALQARAAARAGFHVLQIDLQGCGDSDGELVDTGWSDWIEDVVQAANWLRRAHPADTHRPLWLWGLRAGALLAVQARRERHQDLGPCELLLWQAPAQGRSVVQGFLRLAKAAEWTAGSARADAPGGAELRQRLAAGEAVEIAGLAVRSALLEPLEAATMSPPGGAPGRLMWLEVRGGGGGELLPASEAVLTAWRAAGWSVACRVAQGPAFWQTVEIEESPELVTATLDLLGLEESCT